MKNTNLLELLKEKNRSDYESFLKTMEIGKISEEEETEFFKSAPDDWKSSYISVSYPQPASERVLMISGSMETLKKSYELWGFWDENVNWAFLSGTHEVCKKIILCMTYRPSTESEILMLKRNSRELLTLWLEKYKSLSEDAEKLINDDIELLLLKNIYIEQQIAAAQNMSSV